MITHNEITLELPVETLSIKPVFKPSALKLVMVYRGYTQTKLSKEIKGLQQSNISKFLKGYHGCLSEKMLKQIMEHLDWPFEFIYRDVTPLKSNPNPKTNYTPLKILH